MCTYQAQKCIFFCKSKPSNPQCGQTFLKSKSSFKFYSPTISRSFLSFLIFIQEAAEVNLFQKHLFLYQLTHNMTKDCSLNYEFSIWKFQAQNIFFTQIIFLFLFWHSEQFMYTTCFELGIFMYWTHNSMNNLLSYFGLVDVGISDSEKKLPVHLPILLA